MIQELLRNTLEQQLPKEYKSWGTYKHFIATTRKTFNIAAIAWHTTHATIEHYTHTNLQTQLDITTTTLTYHDPDIIPKILEILKDSHRHWREATPNLVWRSKTTLEFARA